LLAKNAIESTQIKTQKRAATLYEVPYSTLQRRLKGVQAQAESNTPKQKLKPSEHEASVNWCLDLDKHGFPPQLIDICEMANTLLAARHNTATSPVVGKDWVARFISGEPRLATKWNRKICSQPAKCEDPATVRQ
jgi:hypothetical protein